MWWRHSQSEIVGIFNNAIFNNAVFNTTPQTPPGVDLPGIVQPIAPIGTFGGGGIPVSHGRFEQPFVPKKKPYVYKRNTENQDRADIEDILRILEKGGFIE